MNYIKHQNSHIITMNEIQDPLHMLMKKLQQARLLSLIKILKVEFYNNDDYYTPPHEWRVHLPDMKRPEIPLGERKQLLIDEIKYELCRFSNEFQNKCRDIDRKYFM
jgi:hypothetical protein